MIIKQHSDSVFLIDDRPFQRGNYRFYFDNKTQTKVALWDNIQLKFVLGGYRPITDWQNESGTIFTNRHSFETYYKEFIYASLGGNGSGVTDIDLLDTSSGIEFTGGFAGKPLSNNYAWQSGTGIEITSADVSAKIYKTFSLDRDVHLAVDTPYWSDPTPASHVDKGVFGGSYMPSGVDNVFDFTTVDPDTYEDGSNISTVGGIDMSNFSVGDTIRVRFDFNAVPKIPNTLIEPAIWYKNRDSNDNVTFTFPLTATPIFYGTGTPAKVHLNRVEMSIYVASQEDINALAKFSIKSDNPITIQPLSSLLTLIR